MAPCAGEGRKDRQLAQQLDSTALLMDVIDALDVMSGYLRGKLAEQRRANTTADDDLAGRVEMATTTRGRITQLKMGI